MKQLLLAALISFTAFGYAAQSTANTLGHDPLLGTGNFNLYGVINSHGDSVEALYHFVYSTDPGFSTSTSTPVKIVVCDSVGVAFAKLTGITPATTYYYYLSVTDVNGSYNANTLSFYSDTVNTVFENAGADVYPSIQFSNSASLNGHVAGLTSSTAITFEWGDTPLLDSVIPSDVGTVSNSNSRAIRGYLGNLAYGKTYYYRMKGVTATDSFYTDIRPFYIGFPYSLIHSLAPTSVATTTADLNGQVQGFAVPLKLNFEYGIGCGCKHSPLGYIDSTNTVYNFTYHASQLTGNQLYYYRLKAESWLGNFYGEDMLFITGNKDSVFQTHAATNITGTTATLNGIASHLSFQMTAGFQYGTTPAMTNFAFSDTIADTLSHNTALAVTNLQPNTTYYFMAVGGNIWGGPPHIYGDTLQFTTGPLGIDNLTSENTGFITYPNPVSTYLHLSFTKNNFDYVKVFDVAGRELMNKLITGEDRIDVSSLYPGIYAIQAYNKRGEKTTAKKFIKE